MINRKIVYDKLVIPIEKALGIEKIDFDVLSQKINFRILPEPLPLFGKSGKTTPRPEGENR